MVSAQPIRQNKMGKERFIKGKVDNGHHDGLYANTKRLQEAESHLAEALEDLPVKIGGDIYVRRQPETRNEGGTNTKPGG